MTWCRGWRASLPHQWKRGRKLVAGGAPSGREVHVTIVTHSSTQAHIHTKQSIVHSFNPFFTHTVIISPEVSSRRVWRSEKRLAATQHCQEFEHMVNQPHILLGAFNDSIMIDHRQFELVIRILIPFPFSLHTKTHIFLLIYVFTTLHCGTATPRGWRCCSKWVSPTQCQMANTQTRHTHKPGTTKQPNNQTLCRRPSFFPFFSPLLFLRFSVPFFLSFSCFVRFLFLLFLFNVVLLASGAVRVRTRTVFLLG